MDIRLDDLDFSFALDMASGDSDAALSAAIMVFDIKATDPDTDMVLFDQRSDTESIEMTFTASNLQPGTWKVRIYGWSVPGSSQTVYWSARTR